MPLAGVVGLSWNMIHELRFAELDHFVLTRKRITDYTIVEHQLLCEQRFFRIKARQLAKMIPGESKAAEAYRVQFLCINDAEDFI